ncbi:Ribonuclease/ribotoxin [Xylariales sp. PMI_506]|nr:Ribonuclease/ribotoxin [Xylariales sp. PMI_506]
MQFSNSILATLLLAGSSFTGFVSAYPAPVDGENFISLAARGLDVSVGGEPTSTATCPATNNPNRNAQPELTYTVNQLQAAFKTGAKLAANGKTLGDREYPHIFNNKEDLPFDCGANTMEFPIQSSGKAYNGEDVTDIPDRVVFEYSETSKKFVVKFCGVMRHGPTPAFLKCPSN